MFSGLCRHWVIYFSEATICIQTLDIHDDELPTVSEQKSILVQNHLHLLQTWTVQSADKLFAASSLFTLPKYVQTIHLGIYQATQGDTYPVILCLHRDFSSGLVLACGAAYLRMCSHSQTSMFVNAVILYVRVYLCWATWLHVVIVC